jgi:uncharacterized protein YmfQ (DUF2313 family)
MKPESQAKSQQAQPDKKPTLLQQWKAYSRELEKEKARGGTMSQRTAQVVMKVVGGANRKKQNLIKLSRFVVEDWQRRKRLTQEWLSFKPNSPSYLDRRVAS